MTETPWSGPEADVLGDLAEVHRSRGASLRRQPDVTPTWRQWRQQQADIAPLDLEQMRAMVAEAQERQKRFAALFRRATDKP